METRVLSQLDAGFEVDLRERDGQPLALGIGDHPAPLLLDEVVGGVHPVERLVGAAVGVHGDAAVGLHHDEASRQRQVCGQPAVVVHGAIGDHDAHSGGA